MAPSLSLNASAKKVIVADVQLVFAAISFGVGFAGQREASLEHIGPFTFNALRYLLSAVMLISILPLFNTNLKKGSSGKSNDDLLAERSSMVVANNIVNNGSDNDNIESDDTNINFPGSTSDEKDSLTNMGSLESLSSLSTTMVEKHLSLYNERNKILILGSSVAFFNFCGSSFQQIGIDKISSSESAFLTGFYIVFTPLLQFFLPNISSHGRPNKQTWIAVAMALVGLFIMSGSSLSDMRLGRGEVLTLVGSVFWTLYILLTDISTDLVDPILLTVANLSFTALYSALFSLFLEYGEWNYQHIASSWKVVVFLGAIECLGYTLGASGQTYAPPHHAAMIYSTELVWASIGGYILVHEPLTSREVAGCALMIAANLLMVKFDGCDVKAAAVRALDPCQELLCRGKSNIFKRLFAK